MCACGDMEVRFRMKNSIAYRVKCRVPCTSLLFVACLGTGVAFLDACSSSSPSNAPIPDGGGDATIPDAGEGGASTDASDSGAEAGPLDSSEAASDVVTDSPASDAIDGGPSDAAIDVTGDAADAAPCTGVLCNGACLAASDCRACSGATLLCAASNTCVSKCSDHCGAPDAGSARPIDCFACNAFGFDPLGTCEPDDTTAYCLNGRYAGQYLDGGNGYVCSCDDAGTKCPGASQVCASVGQGTFCLNCGQVATVSLQDAGCQGGGACNEATHACQ
jgi:hypothetical protein